MQEIENFNKNIIIRSIELINFMCHDHIIIDFKKPFTCIGGRNGSGKSAIMISLGILFGQRSANLDRGNSFKNFIKTNEQFCVIKCILNNSKKFMYDFFGDYIIIEKRITNKSSSFSISNRSKKNYSTKMEDLDYLLDFYNIKLNNFLNFMTQEQSKKFLSTSDPKHLYNLFLKGTELADIKAINQKYEKNLNIMKEKIDNIEIAYNENNNKLNQELNRYEILSNIEKLQEQITNNEIEIKWANIYVYKQKIEELQKQILELDDELFKHQNESKNILEESEKLKQEKKHIVEHNLALKNLNNENLKKIDETIMKKEKTLRLINNDLIELKNVYENKKDLINRFEKSHSFIDRRDDLKKKRDKIKKHLEDKKIIQKELKQKIHLKKELSNKEIESKNEHDKKIFTLQKQLKYYQSNDENEILHPAMNQILREIKTTKFTDQIIGPIANYISLKDQKWWKTVSIILKNILSSFVCFNNKDREILTSIFKKNGTSFTILIPSNRFENVIKYEKNNNFLTLLDILNVKNPVVLNQLIIMVGIEQIALVNSRTEAYKFMRKNPHNIESIYLITGDRIKKQGDSISDFAPRKQDKYFFENSQNKKKEILSKLNLLQQNKPDLCHSQEFEKIKSEYDDIIQNIDLSERKLIDLERQLENEEEMFNMQKDIVCNEEIYESYKNIEMQINILNKKISNTKVEILNLNKEKENINNTHYSSVLEFEKKLQKLQLQLNVTNDFILKLVQKKVLIDEQIQKVTAEYETNKKKLIVELKTQNLNATEIKNPRPIKEINNEISNLNVEINETKKVGNKEETKEKILKLTEKKNELEKSLFDHKDRIKNIFDSFQLRINRREEIKEFIAVKASSKFNELTMQRGYKGELKFNHKDEKLELNMGVHNYEICGSKETLSGGEKSFAAMSLLFSLWPYVSCPIKILDEFDVFMDDLNRKFIIQNFIKHFKKIKNQVILITPLNTKDLEDDDVDIQILISPEENVER